MKAITQGLSKSYNGKKVLDNLSFRIEENEIVAMVGPNGAGKTTLLEVLMTLRNYDQGVVQVLGHNLKNELEVQKVRSKIGVVFQEGGMYAYLKIREVLDLFAGFYGASKEDVQKIVSLFSLDSHLNEKYEKLSGGWKQRTLLAISFLNKPSLIFLDEPTTGLDPQATHDLWEVIKLSKQQGTSILLSTHSLEEIDMYCDRVMILSDQRIQEFDSPTNLKSKYGSQYFKEVYFQIVKGERVKHDKVHG
ncbi:ABC transporter ATP-binding protein [Bacillus salitolerans]|uniref:ABC transporter ATP-binding protein n=1 Tax=Bacillus salitolerans TaxID=1437434 RepID=A0ABW4LXS1_9BACI